MKKAADLLGADATTVSRHIKRLSTQYQAVLFTMSHGGRWEITNEGRFLLEAGMRIQNTIENLQINDADGATEPTVTITSLEFLLTHYLAPKARSFYDNILNVKLVLLGSDRRLSLAY